MRILKAVLAGSLLLIVLGIASAPAAFASPVSVTVNDVQFTANVSGSSVSLSIVCTNTSVCGGWYLGDVTLKGFTFSSFSGTGAPAGYAISNGGQDNKAVGSGGGCNGTQGGQAICWDAPSTLTT